MRDMATEMSRLQLAVDLEALGAGTLSASDFRARYEVLSASPIAQVILPALEHFLVDTDIRRRDRSYAAMQEAALARLVQLLREGASDFELRAVTFLR